MEGIDQVIAAYHIKPVTVSKISDRVYKIDDGQQQYALKKSSLTGQRLRSWERAFADAHHRQLSSILSLFLTVNNSLYSTFDQDYYYLTPWINGEESTIEQLYRSIGKIHKKTQQHQIVDHDQVIHQFSQYKQYCDESLKRLLSYVKQFESHLYMSPLELQVCTHYRDIELVFRKMNGQITRFIDEQDEVLSWHYSLCHGNLKQTHSIQGHQTYLINWEHASYQHPTTDLVKLFKNELIHYDAPAKAWIDSFKVYMEENKLQNHELSLLLIYLLDPTDYMEIIQQYHEQRSDQSLINQIKKLQIKYRQLLFGLQLLDFIDQQYLSIIASDLE